MSRQACKQRGYALVLTLFLLALMTIVATRLADRTDALRAEGQFWESYSKGQSAMASAWAETLFSLAVRPMTFAGFGLSGDNANLVVSDGRSYRADSGAIVRIVDSRATLSVNAPHREMLTHLLVSYGISPQKADRMIDILEDYIDIDDLKRLNGAEKEEYRAFGLPPPRNDWMLTLDELDRLPEWNTDMDLLDRIRPRLSTKRNQQLNPNLLSKDLLAVLPGATPERVALFDTLRQQEHFAGSLPAKMRTGWPFPDYGSQHGHGFDLYFRPSTELSVRITHPDLPYGRSAVLRLKAVNDAPWTVSESMIVPNPTATLTDPLVPDSFRPLPVAYTGKAWELNP